MTSEPYTITEDTSLEEVVTLMEKHRIKRLPVVRKKLLVGIVSRANLLHALASVAPSTSAPAATDEIIHKDLLIELQHEKWAPVGFLNVIVRNGVVSLWGTITDERERQALIVAAQNIPGVKDVQDHLVWVEPMSGVVIGAKGEVVAA
jgi:predicted transcriptional regulator